MSTISLIKPIRHDAYFFINDLPVEVLSNRGSIKYTLQLLVKTCNVSCGIKVRIVQLRNINPLPLVCIYNTYKTLCAKADW